MKLQTDERALLSICRVKLTESSNFLQISDVCSEHRGLRREPIAAIGISDDNKLTRSLLEGGREMKSNCRAKHQYPILWRAIATIRHLPDRNRRSEFPRPCFPSPCLGSVILGFSLLLSQNMSVGETARVRRRIQLESTGIEADLFTDMRARSVDGSEGTAPKFPDRIEGLTAIQVRDSISSSATSDRPVDSKHRSDLPKIVAVAGIWFVLSAGYLIYLIEISRRRSRQILEINRELTREIRDRVASETRFRAVAEGSSDALLIFDPLRDRRENILDFTCVYLNKNAEILIAKSETEAKGERLTDLLAGHSQVSLEDYIRAVETRTTLEREFSILSPDRQAKWFRQQVVPLQNSILITFRDIGAVKVRQEQFLKQLQRERLIGEIARHIRQSLTLEEILNTTVTEVRKFLDADRVHIHCFQEEVKQLAQIESVNPAFSTMLGFAINDPAMFVKDYLKFYQAGDAIAVPNLDDTRFSSTTLELLEFFQVRSLLIVPIPVQNLDAEHVLEPTDGRTSNGLWGLLIVHQCSEERRWHPSEIALLKQLANQVGIAVRQSQLYQQAKRQMLREKTINRITYAIRQTLDLNTLFSTATWEIGHHLPVDRVWIWQYRPGDAIWINVSEYRQNLDLPPALNLEISDTDNEIAAKLKQFEVFSVYESHLCRTAASQMLAKKFPGAWLFLPLQFDGQLWGAIAVAIDYSWYDWEESQIEFLDRVATQLSVAIQQSELYHQLQTANGQLQQLACTDGLTQVANRRYFDTYFKQEWSRMAREKKPLSVILCDIDYFKQYNDTYGHQAGDRRLQDVTRAMKGAVKRPADLIARYGGEEFVVILPDTDIEGATRVAADIRSRVAALQIPHRGSRIGSHLTLSLGVASVQLCRGVSPEIPIAKADRALYRAKALGRDRIVLHRIAEDVEITTTQMRDIVGESGTPPDVNSP